MATCLAVAYATNRTLIYNSTGLNYDKKGFDEVFMPLSHSCTDWPDGEHNAWLKHQKHDLIIEVDEDKVLGVKR